MRTSLGEKVVWITGASSGIGKALAFEMASKGARLILSARREDELDRVRQQCKTKYEAEAIVLPLDITSTQTLTEKTQTAIQAFGHVDILINNCGISQRSFAEETHIEIDRKLMEVNYFGAITLTKLILPHFQLRGTGHFVTVSSVTGKFGTPYRSGYAASKHALHGFFDSLRAELWKSTKDQIRVTLLCPGFIQTPITLSAVTGDGSPLNKMDEATYRGKPAEWCARKMVAAIERNRTEAYIGGKEVMAVYLKRFFPTLLERVIRSFPVR